MMKTLGFFSVIKLVFTSSLLLLFLNATISLYTNLSITKPLFFNLVSSSSNNSNLFSINTSSPSYSSNSTSFNVHIFEKTSSLPSSITNQTHNSNYSVSQSSVFAPSSSSSPILINSLSNNTSSSDSSISKTLPSRHAIANQTHNSNFSVFAPSSSSPIPINLFSNNTSSSYSSNSKTLPSITNQTHNSNYPVSQSFAFPPSSFSSIPINSFSNNTSSWDSSNSKTLPSPSINNQTHNSNYSAFPPSSSFSSIPINSFSNNTSSSYSSNSKTLSSPHAITNQTQNSNYSVSPLSALTPSSSTYAQKSGMRSTASCDLSKGEWIKDDRAPYYTNRTCGTIQEHQNCMKYGRPDMDFLKWRWKPDDCELGLLDPIRFLEGMRGKNIAFVGDSLARNQMQSLMCLLSRVETPTEVKTAPPASSENLTRMFYPNHNFTIWIFWSPFLVRAAQRSNQTTTNPAWNLYLDEPDPVWQLHLPVFDYLVLNSGNWFTRPAVFHLNRIVVGCEYCPIPAPFMSIPRANRHAFRTALNAVAAAGRRGFRGITVVRTVSPSHFEGGEWNSGGDCVRTGPFRRTEAPRLEGLEMEMWKEQTKELWKAKWEGRRLGLDFRLMDTTAAMLMRPDGHPSRYGHWPDDEYAKYKDCVHWCLPGPVDMWNDFLFHLISI